MKIDEISKEKEELKEFVWTPASSQGLAKLASFVGIGPITAHVILLALIIFSYWVAFDGPQDLSWKIKKFFQNLKDRKEGQKINPEALKIDIEEAINKLPIGKRNFAKGQMNRIVKAVQNKDYQTAGNILRQTQNYLKKVTKA